MIESIHLKNVASYDNDGVFIENLKKINFIYGANGSGKTTVSNFLNGTNDSRYPDCQIDWSRGEEIETLVYNKEFKERNFGRGSVDGVFTLGQATKEQIETIESKKKVADELKKDILKKREKIKEIKESVVEEENTFKELLWKNAYKKHEQDFKEAFRGVALTKVGFYKECLKQKEVNKSDLIAKEQLVKKAEVLLNKSPVKLDLIPTQEFDKLLLLEGKGVWKKRIVGKADVDIAKLIQRLNINDWVHQGMSFIEDETKTCPFCQKDTIDEDFEKQLNSFFDEEYMHATKDLKESSQDYVQSFSLLVQHFNEIEKSQAEIKDSKLDLSHFVPLFKSFQVLTLSNKELIESKLKEPSRSIELHSFEETLNGLFKLIDKANSQIVEHNKMVVNYQDERRQLIDEIWQFILFQEKSSIDAFLKKDNGLKKGIEVLQKQYDEKAAEWKVIDSSIKSLNKNVTSVQPTIDEINRLLISFGFLNFQIVPFDTDPNQYQILRENGDLAEHTLSEGEITFITFLYFLQLAKGGLTEDSVNNDRVLVIDDPISSLDSSVLFIVSTLIKELIKNVKNENSIVKQIIVLTHNIYFHKEVSFEGLRPKGERPIFWILRKKGKATKIQFYGENNPIHSSYELLWNELRNWENNSGITIQNTMRRILENYFSILGSRRDDFIINAFSTYEDKEICRSLLSWVNEGSHTLPDDLLIEIPDDTIESYLNVFKGIFEYTQNSGHYYMMMKEEPEEIAV